MLLIRYTDFWYDIYNIEKDEIKALNVYIDYVEKNLRIFNPITYTYDSVSTLFMNKHLDYLQEAFTSLLLKNYNAFSCLIRIIIENYVSFLLIKKYKNKYIFKDWYVWSFNKIKNKIEDEKIKNGMELSFKKLCDKLNISFDFIDNIKSYGWLKRVWKIKNDSFKSICDEIYPNIYEDYSYLSNIMHNNDMLTKLNWVDMTYLTKYLYLLYFYTDNMIKAYKFNVTRRKEYNKLCISFLESLDECCNYHETIN